MTVFTPQALLNLKKFRKKRKKDNSRNPNPKTPKMMGDTEKFVKKENRERLSKADIERLRERLKSQSQIPKFPMAPDPSNNNFKREPFRLKPKVQPMRRKRGGDTPGLKDYVKKSDSKNKLITVFDTKTGENTFASRNQIMTSRDRYKPAEGSPFKKAIKQIMEKREPGGRFSKADRELAKNMLKKRKGGEISKIDKLRSTKGQFTIGGRLQTFKDKLKKSFGKKSFGKKIGGAMLKNPGKADLNKDGKLSGYEKKRGMAIEKSMSGKKFGGAIKGFGAARRKGMGLQDEMMKPGKVMNAKRGRMAQQKKKKSEFGAYNKLRDVIDQKQKRKQRMDDFMKDRKKIIEKKKGIPVKKGGMMKYSKGGGADTGRMGEIKSKLATSSDKFKRFFKPRKKLEAPKRRPMKPLNKNLKKFAQTSKLTPTGIGKLGAKKVTGKMGGGMMMLMKKAKDKGAKPLEFLSPMAMLKRVQGRKMGGGMMQRPMAYKMGGDLKAATKKLKAQGYKKGGRPSVKKPVIKIAIGIGKAKNFPGIKKLMEKNKKGKKNF
jgi:hypothetical protein